MLHSAGAAVLTITRARANIDPVQCVDGSFAVVEEVTWFAAASASEPLESAVAPPVDELATLSQLAEERTPIVLHRYRLLPLTRQREGDLMAVFPQHASAKARMRTTGEVATAALVKETVTQPEVEPAAVQQL